MKDMTFSVTLMMTFHLLLVYQLRAQNLTFVTPMPEQVGTLTMHFPEVSGGTLPLETVPDPLFWDGGYEFHF